MGIVTIIGILNLVIVKKLRVSTFVNTRKTDESFDHHHSCAHTNSRRLPQNDDHVDPSRRTNTENLLLLLRVKLTQSLVVCESEPKHSTLIFNTADTYTFINTTFYW